MCTKLTKYTMYIKSKISKYISTYIHSELTELCMYFYQGFWEHLCENMHSYKLEKILFQTIVPRVFQDRSNSDPVWPRKWLFPVENLYIKGQDRYLPFEKMKLVYIHTYLLTYLSSFTTFEFGVSNILRVNFPIS